MAKLKAGVGGKYSLTDWHRDQTGPDIEVLPPDIGDAKTPIRLVITVDENGVIRSYNHPSTPIADRIKILPDDQPYEIGRLHASATITLMAYQETGKDFVELGIWYNTSTGRKMTS